MRLVAHGAEGDIPSLMAWNDITAVLVRDCRNAVTLIHDAGIGNSLARLCIGDYTCYLLSTQRKPRGQEKKKQ